MTSYHYDFLTYAPRSGSTHLAHLISHAFPHVQVMPEFRLPEFLFTAGEDRVWAMTSAAVLKTLRLDMQLKSNLSLTDADLKAIAERCGHLGTVGILNEVVCRFSSLTEGRVLLKLGRAAAFVKEIHRVLPEAYYLHCVRDGRAVVNSLLSTKKVYYPGETMGRGDVVWSSAVWNRQIDQANAIAYHSDQLITIRYESLLLEPEGVLEMLAPRLKASPSGPESVRSGPEAVPFLVRGRESTIHGLVGEASKLERVDAWKEELPFSAGVVAEYLMRRRLTALGYSSYYSARRARGLLLCWVCLSYARHVASECVYGVKRVVRHWRQPRLIAAHLKVLARVGRRQSRV